MSMGLSKVHSESSKFEFDQLHCDAALDEIIQKYFWSSFALWIHPDVLGATILSGILYC